MPALREGVPDDDRHPRAEGGLLRATATGAAVAWSALFGAIWLLLTGFIVESFVRGPVNSGDVSESLAEVALLSGIVGPYANALALPITAPAAVIVGFAWAWIRANRSGSRAAAVPIAQA